MKKVAVLLLALLALTGCGDMSKDELGRAIDTVTSLAAEGQLVADGVARDRTKATYARVHAGELADGASHEAQRLADSDMAQGLGEARDTAVDYAEAVADALGEIETRPGDESAGRLARRQLRELVQKLSTLGERI
jgi:hypothetical protein